MKHRHTKIVTFSSDTHRTGIHAQHQSQSTQEQAHHGRDMCVTWARPIPKENICNVLHHNEMGWQKFNS